MPNRTRPTWIAVLDGAQARFFMLRRGDEGQVFEELSTPLPLKRNGQADRPRDGMQFAREVAVILDTALAEWRYEHLVLVAPPRNLAELRAVFPARVRETLAHQVPKNLTKLGTEVLWQKLSLVLLKAARPVNGNGARVASVSGNSLPVSVVFRNMEASPAIQSAAVKCAAKLGRKFGRIQNCRVIIDAPKRVHRKVKAFRVAVDLKVPGREIATKIASSDGGSHDDLSLALRDAFVVAERQLRDHMHRIKGEVMRERRQSSPRMRGVAA